ncbi:hypothetical protein ADK35_01650 [Streptomyces viridochromogenes]|nr:hypothetical protein ADK36_14215 [Streptomyces viridochromogenes]KOG29987.1 hypothetical protein ADK35_01650 [Streptomyces viridochromogenes]
MGSRRTRSSTSFLGRCCGCLFPPRAGGLDHVPAEGAAIVGGNHLSFADPLLMPAVLKRRITFLAKAEYFTAPGMNLHCPCWPQQRWVTRMSPPADHIRREAAGGSPPGLPR